MGFATFFPVWSNLIGPKKVIRSVLAMASRTFSGSRVLARSKASAKTSTDAVDSAAW